MDGETLFAIFLGLAMLAYIVLYVQGRMYLRREGFQAGAGSNEKTVNELYPSPPPLLFQRELKKDGGEGNVLMEQVTLDPVAQEAIQSLDDYEYNMIFQNESDRELSTQLRNKLMSQRPMEWAGLPPSSSQFQAGLRESFQNASPTVPDNAQPFRNIDGSNMVPPDTTSIEMEERKLLQTYVPPTAKEITTYAPEEKPAEQLIREIYDVKGLVPTVAHKEGTNVYEVIGVRRKDERVVYEDEEAPATAGAVAAAGENTVYAPQVAKDMAASTDPYYDTNKPSRMSKWDYTAWTPGLERMFAPTEATQNWY
jgi:hypothetical protein